MSLDQSSESYIKDQKQQYEAIVALLHDAGYYRVNISTLTAFDKVVGGLCWCIISSGEAVDVDILFTENATIGERISLSEAIVTALRQMKCPHSLQSHEIQGGNAGIHYNAIYPVLSWLIDKFSQRREELEWRLRTFSILECNRKCPLRTVEKYEVSEALMDILARRKAQRLYKREPTVGETEERRVHSVLLEYGDGAMGLRVDVGRASASDLTGMKASELNAFEKKLASAQREAAREEEAFQKRSGEEETALMGEMSSLGGRDGSTVGGQTAGALLLSGAGDIGAFASAHEAELARERTEMERQLAGGRAQAAATHRRHLETLNKQLGRARADVAAAQQELTDAEGQQKQAEAARAAVLLALKKLQEESAALDQEAAAHPQDVLAKLRALVAKREGYKREEADFRASCAASRKAMEAELAGLNEVASSSDEEKRLRKIMESFANAQAIYREKLAERADVSRLVSSQQRKIDDVPSRSELIQYERRFEELHRQNASKLVEIKKYVGVYNNLKTILEFNERNIKLLNSISDNFDIAMQDSDTTRMYLSQCADIVSKTNASLGQQRDILESKTNEVNTSKAAYQQLVDQQRDYYKAIKDFQKECEKSEWLEGMLDSLQGSS